MLIIIDAALPDALAEQIQALSPKIRLHHISNMGQPIPKDVLRDAEVIYTTAANFDPADAPRLRWVQSNTAATNPQVNAPILRSKIPLTNVTGAYTTAVAECALAMLLALTRKITLGIRATKWPDSWDDWAGDDLYGKTMGIVGYGSIGRHVARLANAFGMKVLACKRRPEQRTDKAYGLPHTGDPEGKIPQAWFGQDQIGVMFRQSDIAMLTVPDVPTTQQIVGRAELAALPSHAWFVNVGRGAVVDEPALVEALQAGKLAGAALDVFAEEPLPTTSPLWKMSNVVIMPHVASWTTMQATRAAEVLLENVRRDLKGEPLINVVDKQLMY